MKRTLFLLMAALGMLPAFSQESIDISGEWMFSLGDSTHYDSYVILPGSVQTNGMGENVSVNNYVGKAWYKKSVYVPQSWKGQRMVLFLERPNNETTLYVNGREAGRQMSLSTPHQYDISKLLVPGQRNTITICVYNGIMGRMELQQKPLRLFFRKVKLLPDMENGKLRLTVSVDGARLFFDDPYFMQVFLEVVGQEKKDPVPFFVPVTDYETTADIPLSDSTYVWDEFQPKLYRIGIALGDDFYETTFGMREIRIKDRQLYLNGRPIWLRGIVENCSSPETGYPPMEEVEWTRIFQKCKEYGLNYMRFRSWCPPEAAFATADKVGFYLQPEGPSWSNHGVTLGEDQAFYKYLLEESKRIVDTYGHHPSFVMMASGNEPSDDKVSYWNEWTKEMKKYDSSKIYCDASVGGSGLIKEISQDLLHDNGMASQAEKSLMAIGKLQTLSYKYEIESNLRTSDYAGFQLLSLNDYTSPAEWLEFCSPVVALAKFPKFVYANTDSLIVPVEAYNAMYGEIQNTRNIYYLCDDSLKVLSGGILSTGVLPVGKNIFLGTVRLSLENIKRPSKLTLVVAVAGKLKNHWDFWVYPTDSVGTAETEIPKDLYVSDTLDAQAMDILKKGGKVLLTAAGNTSKYQMRPPHTTCAYIDKSHPLFKYGFPTDDWSNLNWWELLNKAQVMNLMAFPKDYQPPIQPIDTYHIGRKLGMLVEANVLKGKLLMTTMDISTDLDHRLVARQMRKAILAYMQSDDFQPSLTLQPETITDLLAKTSPKYDIFTKDNPANLIPAARY